VPPTAAAIATQVDQALTTSHGSGGWALGSAAPVNWLTAASVAASALVGKGDWLTAGAYTAPPTAAAIATQVDQVLTTAHGAGGWALGATAPANWVAAASIAPGALDGKGDWLPAGALSFTVAGQVDANVRYVNGTQVVGDGQVGTEWGPAP